MQLVGTGRCHVEGDVAPISSALLPLVALVAIVAQDGV